MDIFLQSDGQLYPPRIAPQKPPHNEPHKNGPHGDGDKPHREEPRKDDPHRDDSCKEDSHRDDPHRGEPPCEIAPKPGPHRPERPKGETGWEDLLLLAVAFVVLYNDDQPDLPLLLALAYVLFDSCFSLQNLL